VAKKKFDIGYVEYLDIRDIAFSYFFPEGIKIPEGQAQSTQYNLEVVKMFSIEQEIIRLLFSLHLKSQLDNKQEITGLYTTEHLFKLNNFSVWVNKVGDNIHVNEDLDDTLTGLVYSTVRGALHQKFQNTWFSNFILPIATPTPID
jgi:hypothetical protein